MQESDLFDRLPSFELKMVKAVVGISYFQEDMKDDEKQQGLS